MTLARIIRSSRGEQAAELVLKNARIVIREARAPASVLFAAWASSGGPWR
jgi:hypothetical protein